MTDKFIEIVEGLRRLREAVPLPKVFGLEAHGFRTNPRLSEETVREFELLHQIRLPEDYRGFLIKVGNGGAGPAYRLFKLGEMDSGWGHRSWTKDDSVVGVLAEPFPHVSPWNDLSEKPVYDESREDDIEWEDDYNRQMNAWEDRVYWNTANVNGAIPICHLGCAGRQWLIVTGAERSNVWDDARADYGGLKPLSGPLGRSTFLQWYLCWLNEALHELR